MTIRALVRHLALPVALLAASVGASASDTGPQPGTPAPDFRMTTTGGTTVSLSSFRGKTLVLNVWATWCPPCREETPGLIAATKSLRDPSVAFLGVDTTEDAPLVRAFAASKGLTYPQAIDRDHAFAKAYGIRYFPTTIVIDPNGIVRARHIDEIATPQLTAYITAAKRGENGHISSKLQTQIDDLLAQPKLTFTGDPASVHKDIDAALAAIDKADALTDKSDPAKGEVTDFYRMQSEENALRERAIAALEPIATTDKEKELLARLRGDAASAREHWTEATDRYNEALAIDPKDKDALSGLAMAESAQNHDQEYLQTVDRLASIDPSPSNEITLANAYAKLKDWPPALASASAGVAAAQKAVERKPGDRKAIKMLAWTHLYAGRIAAKAGETARARNEFADVTRWTMKLPANDNRYAMYLEEAQEATVALDLGARSRAVTSLSLSPWTGPDLPGSVASTAKYRLVVAGPAGKTVALSASGLPKRWIASFCSDRVCAPFRTTVAIPASGVKVVEFQVIPAESGAKVHPKVRIDGSDGTKRTSTTTVIAAR